MNTIQKLVEQYIPLANKLAYQRKKNLPKFIDIEELKSAAYLGLVEAASRYNPELGIEFTTFSYPRIRGAILDYLRQQDWKNDGPMLSLDMPSDENGCTLRDTIEAKPEGNTDECFEIISLKFDDQAKAVLRHYFIDEYSMKEVGEKFGVSESRISQLIKQYKMNIQQDWTEESLRELLAA